MSIIVTGASGHFGRGAAERLLRMREPGEITLVTRNPDSLADLAERGASVRYGDFDQPESLVDAFAGGERMLLISTLSVGRRVPQHGLAIDAARKAGVRHIVYTSSAGTEDNRALEVTEHRGTEDVLRKCGLDWTFMRNSQYAEAMAEMAIPHHLAAGRWVASSGDGRIALVSREDCIESAVAVLTTPGHEGMIYDITGPELLTFREVNEMLAEISGRRIDYVVVTDEQMYEFFDSLGVPRQASDDPYAEPIPWCSDGMVSFEKAIREGHFAIISDAVYKLTGRMPRTMREVLIQYRHLYNSDAETVDYSAVP